MDYKVEKKQIVPILNGRKCTCKYPWNNMDVGDSFLVKGYTEAKQSSILASGQKWSKRNNKLIKFASRKEYNGIRIFRTQ